MPNLPNFKIDRRYFLTATAAVTTCGAVGTLEALPKASVIPIPNAATSIPLPNLSPVTAFHIAKIEQRNILRKESDLPLLSIPKELRRLMTVETAERYENFSAAFRNRVRQKKLLQIRRRKGDPEWRPVGMIEGIGFEAEVSTALKKLYGRIGLGYRSISRC